MFQKEIPNAAAADGKLLGVWEAAPCTASFRSMISSVIDTSGVAVVTGGASGLGFEVASRLSRAGMAVVILDVASTADLAAAEAALIAGASACASSNDTHPSAMAVRCDVTQFAACRAAAAAVEAAFPRRRITFLHNNAGIMGDPAAGQILAGPPPDKNWANIFAVNVFGTANILKAFLPGIIESGAAPSGKPSLVVTTSSVVGLVNHIPGPYSLSKFAVTAMCEQLSHELDAMGPAAAHISPHSLHPTIAATGLFGGGAKAARALEASGVTTAGAIIDGLFRGLDEVRGMGVVCVGVVVWLILWWWWGLLAFVSAVAEAVTWHSS